MNICQDFTDLTPNTILDAIEKAIDKPMAGFTNPLNSYINRVYELQCMDGTRIIAKFYRPGRWQFEALVDEHNFMRQCADNEIPVVAPLILANGSTLDKVNDIYFAVYEKRRGREFEANDDEMWFRLGSLIGRIHQVGQWEKAPNRVIMHPAHSTKADLDYLLNSDLIAHKYFAKFKEISKEILTTITPMFENCDLMRIHGDCHKGNILERPGEGLIAIDFDDMAMGPAVQDLWMLLPDHLNNCQHIMNMIIDGYETFQNFNYFSLQLVEPLRIMRILYFLAWCAKQIKDPNFQNKFPNWGTESFWNREINDLQQQLNVIKAVTSNHNINYR